MSWRLRNWFFKLFHPSFWIQNEETNWYWDDILRDAMDSQGVNSVGPYVSKVGGMDIWTSNYPYCFGRAEGYPTGLPAPLTRVRLRDEIMKAVAREARGD